MRKRGKDRKDQMTIEGFSHIDNRLKQLIGETVTAYYPDKKVAIPSTRLKFVKCEKVYRMGQTTINLVNIVHVWPHQNMIVLANEPPALG